MDENRSIGKLYIVATPIGNSKDMSPRGRQILADADMIAAEDTRRSMVLLNKLEIRNKLVSNHKFNEYGKAKYFINELLSGKNVAVISDAGTPCISDPGNELIKAAVEAGIPVIGVPGCCAAVTALSVSGFDLSSFMFYGFFPRENVERRRLLEKMRRGDTRTYALYESPKRIMELVDFFIESGAHCRMCLCNDLTKLHEMSFCCRSGVFAGVADIQHPGPHRVADLHLLRPEELTLRALEIRSVLLDLPGLENFLIVNCQESPGSDRQQL